MVLVLVRDRVHKPYSLQMNQKEDKYEMKTAEIVFISQKEQCDMKSAENSFYKLYITIELREEVKTSRNPA